MTTIDNISFDFVITDEPFVQGLYADWDNFCRLCVEKVVDECLSAYSKEKVLHEIETLDLDLGNILEDDFYQEFPRRLREELLKSLPLWDIQSESQKEKTETSRLENLLFYLEHGYLKAEWADGNFNLTEELEWVATLSGTYTEKIITLCLNREYVLRRLLWQTNNEIILLRIYTSSFSRPSFGLYEKRRILGMFLEVNPEIPICFIHEAKDDKQLNDMAELLDTFSVRQIMVTEAREHAEVDLPPYWHYLYEWLVKYYPFNGLAIFGGKNEFIRHLHFRLLTFIRKRNYSFYLSKEELTAGFLLEVFGQNYYKEVLNAIYDLQPLQADGSPEYDGYLNRELYRMFLYLSLLRLPGTTQISRLPDTAALNAFLKDSRRSYADKRMLLTLLTKERPDLFIEWLRTEAVKDDALVTFVAGTTNRATIDGLLASVSFTAIETVKEITAYLQNYTKRTGRLSGISEASLNLSIRKAVLLWIGSCNSDLSKPENVRQLLCIIYREITGSDNEEVVEEWSVELYASGKEEKQSVIGKDNNIELSIRKVQTLLANKDIPEPVKRRLLVLFLEQHKGNYADAILLLHEYALLEYATDLISPTVVEEIIRQSVIRIVGMDKAAEWQPLVGWLVTHETTISVYLQAPSMKLKAQLLVWLSTTIQSQTGGESGVAGVVHSLLIALFGKENMQTIVNQMFREMVSGTGDIEDNNTEVALNLLLNTGIYTGYSAQIDFMEWLQLSKKHSETIQTLLESYWSTLEGFIGWLEDTSVSTDQKRELLQKVVVEKPQKWISLLHKLPEASKAISLVAGYLSVRSILQGMAKASFHQAAVLSQATEWLQHKMNDYPFLAGHNVTLSSALPQALLLYMQDKDALGGRTLTEQEVIRKFLSYLYLVYTGKSDYRDDAEWMRLSGGCITGGMNRNDIQYVEDKDFTENNEITPDREIAELSDMTRPEILRKRWLRSYLYCQPKELLGYIRLSIIQNNIPLDKWLEWLDMKDWMRLIASLSLSNAELLQQITDCLSENNQAGEIDLCTALAIYIIENHAETCMYNNRNETIHSFVQSLPFKNKKDMDLKVEDVLRMIENYPKEEKLTEAPEIFQVNNAGLCILSPWFPILMNRCGYLDEERKSFKSDLYRIRAVFLLQYLTCSKEEEYAETELAFNRLLVGLPMHLPLPKRLELTAEEKDVADSMLQGVKLNWAQMKNTSMAGFQQSFIVRSGQLVQQEDRWLLTVEERGFDVMIDTIQWNFKLIHMPWLKKYVQVHWHEK